MSVWIVTNGTGGEIDSAWGDEPAAQERADSLNAPGGLALTWSVIEKRVEE